MDTEARLQYLMDRLSIEDQVKLYSRLIDRKEFDRLDMVFTKDAYIDYTASGGIAGSLEQIREYLKKSMKMFSSQHLMSNIECEIAPDRSWAKTTVMLFNPMTMGKGKNRSTFFIGLWYHDDWVLEGGTWKMRRRVQEPGYVYPEAGPKLKSL